jgi:excisionase family DNA binding protein
MQIQLITTPEDLQAVIDSAVSKAFEQITKQPQVSQEITEVIDSKELCKLLDITEPTLKRWRDKGKLPFLQLGSRIRYSKAAVLRALENKKG